MTNLRGRLRSVPVLPVVSVAAVSLIIFLVMNPWLILSPTTPTGGDMGAHVLGPAFIRDVLLPEGRFLGWSNDWFAGFPAFYFYFPLPYMTIVALDFVLPYGVAFKLVTVIGLVALPPAIYFHTRALNLSRHMAIVTAGVGAVFAFYESYSIYGGNIASTLAGEFTYSWSFALSLVYLGLLIKTVRDDRRYAKWAALALALTALSHVLTTFVVVFASLFVLGWKKAFWRTVAIWIWGFAIAAVWALPFVARIGLSSDMAWTPLSRWEEIFPVEIWLLLPVAIPGAIWAMRRSPRAAPMIAATLLPIIYFPLPNVLPELLPEVFTGERWKLYNGRLLPYWYFGVAFFAAIGFGAAVVWLSRRLPDRVHKYWVSAVLAVTFAVATGLVLDSAEFPEGSWAIVAGIGAIIVGLSFFLPLTMGTRSYLTATALAIVALGAASSVTFVDSWAKWNYEGYEAKDPWPEYEALMIELDRLPSGRIMWEHNKNLNRYGTPMSLMLIPYWTEGSHKSMEGLYFESSLTTHFHFLNQAEMSFGPSRPVAGLDYKTFEMERGIEHMDVYGVDYYVTHTPEATEKAVGLDQLNLITAEIEPFSVFELPPTEKVTVATHLPAVYAAPEPSVLGSLLDSDQVIGPNGESLPSFHDMALEWYGDLENMDRLVVADGPEEWPRIEHLRQRPDVELNVPDDAVSNIAIENHRISFTTEAVGLPHIIKVSYFTNWTATGADGPWRATPSLMVVVPTDDEVVLEFRDTWAESTGRLLTLAGMGGLIAAGVFARRLRDSDRGSDRGFELLSR